MLEFENQERANDLWTHSDNELESNVSYTSLASVTT